MAQNFLDNFTCIRCGAVHRPAAAPGTCPSCGGNLDARYDYAAIGNVFSPQRLLENRDPQLWRYAPFLPTGLNASPIDDKNSLFRVERRKSPNCVPPQYVSQDVAGPQIKSRPASSRSLCKCVWPVTSVMSNTDLVTILPKCMHFGNKKPVGYMRCV